MAGDEYRVVAKSGGGWDDKMEGVRRAGTHVESEFPRSTYVLLGK